MLNFYVGAVLEPTALFFDKGERIFLLSQGRYLIPGDRVTITAFNVSKTNLTTSTGDDLFRFSFSFQECCDGCKDARSGNFSHHKLTATVSDMEHMFIVMGKEEVKDKQEEKKVEVRKVSPSESLPTSYKASQIVMMILRIVRMWNSSLDEKQCVLHFGRFKYEVADPLGEQKLRIKQISGYSVRELYADGDHTVDAEWVDPLVSYLKTYDKEFSEIDKLEAEIADLSHRLGYNVYGAS